MLQNRLVRFLVIVALCLGIVDLVINIYNGAFSAIKTRADASAAQTKSDAIGSMLPSTICNNDELRRKYGDKYGCPP